MPHEDYRKSDAYKIEMYNTLSEVLDLENMDYTLNVYNTPGITIHIPVKESHKINQMYEEHTIGSRVKNYRHKHVNLDIRVEYEPIVRRLTLKSRGSMLAPVTVWATVEKEDQVMTDLDILRDAFRQLGIKYVDERNPSYDGGIYHKIIPVGDKNWLFKSEQEMIRRDIKECGLAMRTYHFFEFDSDGDLASY